MKIRRLFEKRNWSIESHGSRTISSDIACYGNYFQLMYAMFRIIMH
uniref:Uncharacterized protein n=1 Tax=Siphoviridae sp. ctWT735 TaxID=2825538 RepID=A0A8S5TUC5_9CAUD|nr:MAG TPA: hypothetical protein [Siphoviridae sp. ctWT735]